MSWIENNTGTSGTWINTGGIEGYKVTLASRGLCSGIRAYFRYSDESVYAKYALYTRSAANTYTLIGYCNTTILCSTGDNFVAHDCFLDRNSDDEEVSSILLEAGDYYVFRKTSGRSQAAYNGEVSDQPYLAGITYESAWADLTGVNETGGQDYRFGLDIYPVTNIEQEGFRFRNDDGDEDGATWKASQDVSVSLPFSTAARIRWLLNATGDPASKNFQLEYRYKPSGGSFGSWTKVR